MSRGFTIVELLIVIVVIAILAAITVVAFNGVQDRARTSKIESDLTMLSKAIVSARIASGEKTFNSITGSTGTSTTCANTAANSDLSNKATFATCWNDYNTTLNTLSTVGGINVRGMQDPWGWPYLIDEQQGSTGAGSCGSQDYISVMVKPHPANSWADTNRKLIPLASVCP